MLIGGAIELGGDAAAHAATSNDLQGVRAYAQLDTPKLFTLGMVPMCLPGGSVP
uniref:Clu domain-containing protein n=1 Tax=Parascaris equorum TaxID=6256 RepID=A0A914RP91_PAREQ